MQAREKSRARAPSAVDRFIGARIKGRRSAIGLSQDKLAGLIGVTFQQIQKYEKGANRVSAATLFRIAKELHVPASDLLPPSEHAPALADDRTLRALAQVTPGLSAEGQTLLVNLARALARCRRLRG